MIAPSWAQSYLLSFTGIGRVDATETLVVVVESDLEPSTGGMYPAGTCSILLFSAASSVSMMSA